MSETRQKDHGEGKERQVVVSVRFPAQLLQRIHAVAAVKDSTANAVIREGIDAYIRDLVRTPAFQADSRAYVERAQANVSAAMQEPEDEGLPAHV